MFLEDLLYTKYVCGLPDYSKNYLMLSYEQITGRAYRMQQLQRIIFLFYRKTLSLMKKNEFHKGRKVDLRF